MFPSETGCGRDINVWRNLILTLKNGPVVTNMENYSDRGMTLELQEVEEDEGEEGHTCSTTSLLMNLISVKR